MKARTHDLAAITGLTIITVVVSPALPPLSLSTIIAAFIANQLGGIAPDIDQPTAPFWRNLPIGGPVGKVIGKLLGGHRFITHSIIGVLLFGWLVSLLLAFINPILRSLQMEYIWWAFMIGMVSHLVMDSFTKEGVPWLLPIPVKFGFPPIKKLRITTGTWKENFVVFPLLAIILVIVCVHYYDILYTLLHAKVVK